MDNENGGKQELMTPKVNLPKGQEDYSSLSVGELRQELKTLLVQEQKLLKRVYQLEAENRALRYFSYQDGLTGLANRRHFNVFFDREFRRAVRENTPLSLILVDIDFFKRYNDTYGHQAGDNCLKQVANLLTGTISRGSDLVARYGGEEFAVVLANTGAEDAAFLAEKLRSRVEALSVLHKNSPISTCITISVGVATMQLNQNDSPDSLTAAADVALYEAKGAGRNCVKSAWPFDSNGPKHPRRIFQDIRPSLSTQQNSV